MILNYLFYDKLIFSTSQNITEKKTNNTIIKNPSKIFVKWINNFKPIVNIERTIKKANISYKIIFKAVTPFIIPANLKNGKCSYKKTDIVFFKINANITIKINRTDITNSLEKPLFELLI